jgi:hypothetical protein
MNVRYFMCMHVCMYDVCMYVCKKLAVTYIETSFGESSKVSFEDNNLISYICTLACYE